MKKCFKCGQVKELSEFYAHSQMKDGHVNKCIECNKKDVMLHREKNIERIREYDRERGKLPHRKEMGKKVLIKYRKEHPLRNRANYRAEKAIKEGTINKPDKCEICGKEVKLLAHHKDYTLPLDVMFVCQPCHKVIHKTFKSEI